MVRVSAGRREVLVSKEPVSAAPANMGRQPMHRVRRDGVTLFVLSSVAKTLMVGKDKVEPEVWARALNALAKAASRASRSGSAQPRELPRAPLSPASSTFSSISSPVASSEGGVEDGGLDSTSSTPSPTRPVADADPVSRRDIELARMRSLIDSLSSEVSTLRLQHACGGATGVPATVGADAPCEAEPTAGSEEELREREVEPVRPSRPPRRKHATRSTTQRALQPASHGNVTQEADEGACRVATPRRASLIGRTGLRPFASYYVEQ
jgi:hypothetical protein